MSSSDGSSKTSATSIPSKVGSSAREFLRTHVSEDASLFSSSMPILPNKKLAFTTEQGHQFADDSFPVSSNLGQGSKDKDPVEEIATGAFGSLLPDDETELLAGIMDDFDLTALPNQLEDLEEYDFFCNGGKMELEPDPQENLSVSMSKVSISDGIAADGIGHYALSGDMGTVAGEHPYGEHPSRTLFVRNINSNVEDTELRSLFEQYGDIRTLYTACKHRGFVMISYYDIRAARTALRALQNKPLRRRKLDIHFSIPKDNPSEKDINQGTLVVFNLDASVSNDELCQIFGAYGEVKEIRETPQKRHHKFIEFYDVRDAEAALRALNRMEIAGKRIKVEPSRPGGARRNLMQQMTQELEYDETGPPRQQVGSSMVSSPPGRWAHFDGPGVQHISQALSSSPVMGSPNLMKANPLLGLASILPTHVSGSPNFAALGRNNHVNHIYTHSGSPRPPTYLQCHSLAEKSLIASPGPSSPLGEVNLPRNGIGTQAVQQFLWGSPTAYIEPRSSSVQAMSSERDLLGPTSSSQAQAYTGHNGSLFRSQSHQPHHAGSAPTRIPLNWQFGSYTGSPVTTLERMHSGHNDGNYVTNKGFSPRVSSSLGFSSNMSENDTGTSMTGFPWQEPTSLLNGSYPEVGKIQMEGLFPRGRSRQIGMMENLTDSKRQYQLDLDKIIKGKDTRTTLMIKNIPNKYTSTMLLAAINEHYEGAYDFLYFPIDFKNKCNMGYAFINMVSPSHVIAFYKSFNGKKWDKFSSGKVASLAYARIQGKSALTTHYKNPNSMIGDELGCPMVPHSVGHGTGDQEPLLLGNLNIHAQPWNGSYSSDFLARSGVKSSDEKLLRSHSNYPIL